MTRSKLLSLAVVLVAVWGSGARPGLAGTAPAASLNEAARRPLILAHRGLSARAPENSLAAFREALAAGADGSELDVRLCKSGEVIVLHDEVVDRVSNGQGVAAEMTLGEIQRLILEPDPAGRYTEERIPTLDQVLGSLGGSSVFLIEMKRPAGITDAGDDLEARVAALIAKYDLYSTTFVSSLNPLAIHKVELAAPRVRTLFEYVKGMADGRPRPDRLAVAGDVDAMGPSIPAATPAFARWARAEGVLTSTFSPYTIEEMEKALSLGFDIVQTHRPSILRLLLQGRLQDTALAKLEPLVEERFEGAAGDPGPGAAAGLEGAPSLVTGGRRGGATALALPVAGAGGLWTDLAAEPEALFYLSFWWKIETQESTEAYRTRLYLVEREERLAPGTAPDPGRVRFRAASLESMPDLRGEHLEQGPRFEEPAAGVPIDSEDWQHVRLPLRTRAGTHALRLLVGASGLHGRILIDDLQLWHLPFPDPIISPRRPIRR